MINPDSLRYKTRAFITGGRLHFLMMTVNNYATRSFRTRTFEERLEIEPLAIFKNGKKPLSVFLEDQGSSLNFQVMEQSKNTSSETSMVPTILRCFRDLIAVMYEIGKEKTVIVYKLYEQPYGEAQGTFEERNCVPEGEIDLEEVGRRTTRFRLKKIIEIDYGIIEMQSLHDIFFFKKDVLCLMVGSDMILWKIQNIVDFEKENPQARSKPEYFRVKIRGNDDKRMNVRKFHLDRINKRLHYLHGKTTWSFERNFYKTRMREYCDKIMVGGKIDLTELNYFLDRLDHTQKSINHEDDLGVPLVELKQSFLDDQSSSIILSSRES